MQDNGGQFGWLKTVVLGRNPRRTLCRALILAVASYVVFGFVLLPVRIEGISMWPTYRDRQFNVANCLAYRWRDPRRAPARRR